jgi:hypothetical protein
VIRYRDIFGDAHYKNFCYYSVLLIPEAVASKNLPKERLFEAEEGKKLKPCPIHNDGD